ncbi:AAA family ATPase [Shewanella indica]|uniref:AAA family ATPase n=1 Tax=Shewanella indica TaxID=768528 RepID=UPI00313CE83F
MPEPRTIDGNSRLAIIMRGLPGSGKSYWVRQFIQELPARLAQNVTERGLCSTDRFFYRNERYCFDAARLAEFHQLNLSRFIEALATGVPVVICDNTNMALWEFAAYQAAAKALGYRVHIQQIGDVGCKTHLHECAERNKHGVSLKSIQRMASQFQTI